MLMPQYIASRRECWSPAAVVAPAHDDATAARAAESEACATAPDGAARPSTNAVRVTASTIARSSIRYPFEPNPAHSCRRIYIQVCFSHAYAPRNRNSAAAGCLGDLVQGFRVLQGG